MYGDNLKKLECMITGLGIQEMDFQVGIRCRMVLGTCKGMVAQRYGDNDRGNNERHHTNNLAIYRSSKTVLLWNITVKTTV